MPHHAVFTRQMDMSGVCQDGCVLLADVLPSTTFNTHLSDTLGHNVRFPLREENAADESEPPAALFTL